MTSALEKGYPIFKCGGVCWWNQWFWIRNPQAKFYCAKCEKPCAIKWFPWVDHWAIWEDWMWNTPGRISDYVLDDEKIEEFEEPSQRQVWSEFCWKGHSWTT